MNQDLGAKRDCFFYVNNHGGLTVRLPQGRSMLPSTAVVAYKSCTKCHISKPLSDFYFKSPKRQSRKSWCKKCILKRYVPYKNLMPWEKTQRSVIRRCAPSGCYYKKGIKNFLTKKDLKFLWFRDKAWLLKEPSIDRIKNNKHYTLENCRYVEMRENARRGGLCKSY